MRRWMASAWDRETFGEDKGDVNVNVINFALIHLDALRHRRVEAKPPESLPRELPPGTDGDDGGAALVVDG